MSTDVKLATDSELPTDTEGAVARTGRLGLINLTLVVAIAYYAGGMVGDLLSLPPSNIALLWPAAGIAVAAILLAGWRAVPGVLVGAAAVHGQLFFDGTSITSILVTGGAGLIIAVGAALQSVVAATFLNRFNLSRETFSSVVSIAGTLLVLGAACVIGASVGTATSIATGLATSANIAWTWGTWWIGDLMGIVLFAPLALAFARRAIAANILLALVLIVGIGGSYLASSGIRTEADNVWHNNADTESRRLTEALVQWIETSLTPFHAMGALFQSSEQVFDAEFWDTVTILEDNQGDFFPSSFVVARPTGFGDFETWEVLYSIEYDGRLVVGTNLNEDPMLRQAVLAAVDNLGQTVVGSVFKDAEGTAWVVPAVAVEQGEDRHVVLGLIDLSQMIDGLFKTQAPDGLELRLFALTDEMPADHAAMLPGDMPDGHTMLLHGDPEPASDVTPTGSIRSVIGGAKLQFLWGATPAFQGGKDSQLAEFVLGGGVIATALLSLFINFLLRQNEKVGRLVSERTAELAESRGMLKSVLDNMPAAVFLKDDQGRFKLINKRYEDIYGVRADDIVGRNLHEIYPKEQADQFLAYDQQVMDSGGVLESQHEATVDGRTITLAEIMFPIRGEDGSMSGFGGVEIDVSERVKSEETARRLREAIEGFSDGMILYDRDERILFTNSKYHELYPDSPLQNEIVGWSQEELLRRLVKLGVIDNPEAKADPEGWVMERLKERRSRGIHSVESTHSSGKTLLIRQRPTTDGGLIVSHTDITERKSAEQAIETQRARLDEILNNLQQAVVVFDKDQRLVACNAQYPDTLGLDGAMLQPGLPIYEIVLTQAKRGDYGPGDPEVLARSRVKTLWAEHSRGDISFRDDRSFDADSSMMPDGGLLITYTDITERKSAEQAIETQRARLDEILNNLQQAVVVFDKDQRLVACNAQYPDTLGLDGAMLQPGLPIYEIVLTQAKRGDYGPGDPEALARSRVKTLWAEHSRGDISFRDDRSFDADSSMMPDGGLLITYTDITERKQMEEAIEAQRAQLDDIISNLQQAVVVFDKDRRLAAWNAQYPEVLNIDASFLKLGLSNFDIALHLATIGNYGEGDPETLAAKRVDALWKEDLRGDITFGAGRTFDALSTRTPDGGLLITYSDITQRKQMEEALRGNEQQLRNMLEDSPIAIAISVDDQSEEDGNIEFANGRFIDMLGFKPEDIGKRARTEHFMPKGENRETHEEMLDQGESLINMECEVQTQDGSSLWVLMSISPIRYLDRQSALIWLYDITERKEAEKTLAEKEAQLRTALVNMSDGFYAVDSELKFVLFNQRAMDMSGLPMEHVGIGTPVEKVIRMLAERGDYGPGDVETHVERRLSMLSDGQHHEMEFVTRANDRVVNLRKSPLESGGAVVLLADVTERKKQEERFRALLESAPDATVIVNADGNIVQTNIQAEKLFGYTTEELLGQKVEVLIPERFRDQHPQHRTSYFKNAGVRPMGIGLELYGRAKDGREFPIELSLSPIETDEGTLVSGAVRDITDRKKAEDDLRAAKEQAEGALSELTKAQNQLVITEKMASLGQLTAGIAHEIKNPLNFVNNFSETSVELLIELAEALEPVQDKFDEDTRDDVEDIVDTLKGDLEKINHHGKRADHIVKSMLLHARGDAVERVPTSINELVDEALNLAYHGERARDKSFNVTMEQHLDDATGEADLQPQEITRVLVNLFGNAFYAVKQRGKEASGGDYSPTVEVWTKDKGSDIEIRVRDNGTGMPEDVREKLFDPFFTTKPTGEGTGLGLSMSFDIIAQQHGGRIEVDSEPGSFTEFVINLPRHPTGDEVRAGK